MSHSVVLERIPFPADAAPGTPKLKRQRVYIFLTRQGLLYSVLLFVVLLGAINYTNSMAYVLTFTLGSLFITGILHTYRNLRGLVLHVNDAAPVFAGEMAGFPLLIDNRFGPLRIGIDFFQYPEKRRENLQSDPALSIDVDARKLFSTSIKIETKKRGHLKLGRIRITSCYPLGLFKAWSYIDCDCACLVYPKPAGDPRSPVPDEDYSDDQTGKRSGTDDFTGFKPYRPGDSISNIDWKILAREQGLMIKRFSGSGTRKLVFHWDQTAHLVDVEKRLSQLCLWVIEAEKQGIRYGLVTPYANLEINQGSKHQAACLYALATHGLP